MLRLSVLTLFCFVGCVSFYSLPPDQLYRVGPTTTVMNERGEKKTLRVAKIYAQLQDGSRVAVMPGQAANLFFDPKLDEEAEISLAVVGGQTARNYAFFGCGLGILAAGGLGAVTEREFCLEEGANGEFFEEDCGLDIENVFEMMISLGLFTCPIGGYSALWLHRMTPEEVDLLPRQTAKN